jgi:hypothetical protein
VIRWLAALLVVVAGCRDAPAAPRPGYFLVGPAGATALDSPAARTGGRLLPGFGLSIVDERDAGGRRVGRTGQGRWVAMAELTAARPSGLRGVTVGPDLRALDVAWVVTAGAPVFASPDGACAPGAAMAGRPVATRPLFARERRGPCTGDLCRTGDGWMRASDLRAPVLAPRPGDVAPGERWIDIDLTSQTLVAYQGDTPVFATLVSTGIGKPGSPLATPEGVFRLRSKHLAASMDNLEHTGVVPYSYQDIPLVQYFTERVALHAALWHQRFGHPASHGCVNLSPADAERLFAFTTPRLPPGAREVWSRPGERPTVVRVHR